MPHKEPLFVVFVLDRAPDVMAPPSRNIINHGVDIYFERAGAFSLAARLVAQHGDCFYARTPADAREMFAILRQLAKEDRNHP